MHGKSSTMDPGRRNRRSLLVLFPTSAWIGSQSIFILPSFSTCLPLNPRTVYASSSLLCLLSHYIYTLTDPYLGGSVAHFGEISLFIRSFGVRMLLRLVVCKYIIFPFLLSIPVANQFELGKYRRWISLTHIRLFCCSALRSSSPNNWRRWRSCTGVTWWCRCPRTCHRTTTWRVRPGAACPRIQKAKGDWWFMFGHW